MKLKYVEAQHKNIILDNITPPTKHPNQKAAA